jgi:hypothetical protein
VTQLYLQALGTHFSRLLRHALATLEQFPSFRHHTQDSNYIPTCNLSEVTAVKYVFVGYKVLTAASMKMTAFWDIEPCSLVGVDRRYRCVYCLHQSEETSVYSKESTGRNIPKDSLHLQIYVC